MSWRIGTLSILIAVVALTSSSVHAMSACERATRSAYIVVKSALRLKVLSTEDVQYMIDAPGKIGDPFADKHRDVDDLALRRELEKHLSRVTPEAVDDFKSKLRELILGAKREEALVAESSQMTAAIVVPHEVQLEIAPEFDVTHGRLDMNWHTDQEGELQLIVYNSDKRQLMLTKQKLALFRDLGRTPGLFAKEPWQVTGDASYLSLPDGNLVLAHIQPTGSAPGGSHVLLYNLEQDRAFVAPLHHHANLLHLVRAADGQIYLIAKGAKSISAYIVEKDKLKPHYQFDAEKEFIFTVDLTSTNGHIAIAAQETLQDGKSRISIIDPIAKAELKHVTQSEAFSLSGILLPDGEAVVSYATAPYQYHFLRTSSREVQKTELLRNSPFSGQFSLTAGGKLLFPIKLSHEVRDEKSGVVNTVTEIRVYEPLKPPVKNLWQKILRKTLPLQPTQTLVPHVTGPSPYPPLWANLKNGRALLTLHSTYGQERHISIFEPELQSEPIGTLLLSRDFNGAGMPLVEMANTKSGLTLLQITDVPAKFVEIFDGENPQNPMVRFKTYPTTRMATDKYGDVYFAGEIYVPRGSVSERKLQLFRMTKGGREAAGR